MILEQMFFSGEHRPDIRIAGAYLSDFNEGPFGAALTNTDPTMIHLSSLLDGVHNLVAEDCTGAIQVEPKEGWLTWSLATMIAGDQHSLLHTHLLTRADFWVYDEVVPLVYNLIHQ